MAGQAEFDHIKVTPSEDEEVIVVGRPSAAEEASFQGRAHGSSEATPVVSLMASTSPPAKQEAPQPSVSGERGGTDARDQYHETTMEDIKSSKMSTMQKVIIAIAIILVIVFIIYSITA